MLQQHDPISIGSYNSPAVARGALIQQPRQTTVELWEGLHDLGHGEHLQLYKK